MSQTPTDPKADQNANSGKVEGEGSYTATRRYNKHLAEHQQSEDVDALAEEAGEAVDGAEGEDLRRAEEAGKRGPTQKNPA